MNKNASKKVYESICLCIVEGFTDCIMASYVEQGIGDSIDFNDLFN